MRVAVLGIGLIGGSIGLAARARAGARVSGWDPDPGVRARALQLGAVDVAGDDIAGAVDGADMVFVAGPVGTLVDTARAALASAGPRTIVTDVGSTKRLITEAISDSRFIGGHPLAGSEVSGVGHAREDLFDGAVWYLTAASVTASSGAQASGGSEGARTAPEEQFSGLAPDGDGYERLAALIRALGAQPVPVDPERHDRLMASVSHLPHVLANVLVAQAVALLGAEGPPGGGQLGTGPSFRDATRVAGSNSAIWTDIYMSNRDALIMAIDELTGRLAQVRAAMDAGDEQALREWNERARAAREMLLRAGS